MTRRKEITALVQEWLQPYFMNKLPSDFGRSAHRMVLEGLRTTGVAEAGVADAVLELGCKHMVGYLQKGGTTPDPESLFQRFCCEALDFVLEDRARGENEALMRLLWGEEPLGKSSFSDESTILERVREAIDHLSDPFKSFLRRDFIEGMAEEDVRLELGLADHEEYLHLRRLSLAGLRESLERLASSKPLRVA